MHCFSPSWHKEKPRNEGVEINYKAFQISILQDWFGSTKLSAVFIAVQSSVSPTVGCLEFKNFPRSQKLRSVKFFYNPGVEILVAVFFSSRVDFGE